MESDQNLRQVELLQALGEASEAIHAFATYVRRQAEGVWLADVPEPPASVQRGGELHMLDNRPQALDAVVDIIRAIDYVDGQDPRTTRKLAGVIALPVEGLRAAMRLNEIRDRVARAWTQLGEEVIEIGPAASGASETVSLRKDVLRRAGRARLNQRQVTRRLLVFSHPIESISLFWNSAPNIKATTCSEVREMLKKPRYEESHKAREDLSLLSVLNDSEPLAIVTPVKPRMCANIRWLDEGGRVIVKSNVKISMPIFVPNGDFPTVKRPQPRTERKKRVDVLIEDCPYLSCMRVHRYTDPQAVLRMRRERAKHKAGAELVQI